MRSLFISLYDLKILDVSCRKGNAKALWEVSRLNENT